jgi:hypothetical protein
MTKLRLSGFEGFTAFVIRCAMHTRRLRPAIHNKNYLGIFVKFDEFSNRQMRLNSVQN